MHKQFLYLFVTLVGLILVNESSHAQRPFRFDFSTNSPPGVVGRSRLLKGDIQPGYMQSVRLYTTKGGLIAAAQGGAFSAPNYGELLVGLRIGQIYRFELSDVPNLPNVRVYPTVEVIDRLYPPHGRENEFPIPIELTRSEIAMAHAGKLVTRVIYVENPDDAIPLAQPKDGTQPYFETAPGEDPLLAADAVGRPVAILRIGGRVPANDGSDAGFYFGSPPLQEFSAVGQAAAVSRAIRRTTRNPLMIRAAHINSNRNPTAIRQGSSR